MNLPGLPFLAAPLGLAWRDGQLTLAVDGAGECVPAPAIAALPEAMATLLARHRGRRVHLRVGDEHVRLFQHERPRGARSPGELEAALRLRMQSLYGDAGQAWTLRWTAAPWARSDTVCALPAALLQAVRAGCQASRTHCTRLRADWIASAADAPRRGRLWVLNAGAGTLTLGLLADGRVLGVRRLPPPGRHDDLADVMARAQPLFGATPEDALAPIWLSGAALPVPRGAASARVRRADDGAAPKATRWQEGAR